MTLETIIRRALIELGRGVDAQSTEAWSERFTMFANDAVQDLAEYLELRRTDTVEVEWTTLPLSLLERPCLKVLSVKKAGTDVIFTQGASSEEIMVGTNGTLTVEYRYAPKEMANRIDEPDVPENLHPLIVSYAVYREHLTADPTMQRRADAFYQLYETGKRKARKTLGETDTYAFKNTGW